MDLKFCVYNVEWMKNMFYANGTPKTSQSGGVQSRKDGLRSEQLAQIVKAINPDILCIVEGPDTTKSGSKSSSQQLKNWCEHHELTNYDAIEGITSSGQQELCAIYNKDKVNLVHIPEKNARKNPFDQPFYVDTEDSLIKEKYSHYRPPFELSIRNPSDNTELGRVIVAHTKSKGIFDNVDLARYEQLSERNRKKLYAECYSIRERCDQWLDENPDQKIIVCGDINDGAGMDYYEQRLNKSAMEVLLGDVWNPDLKDASQDVDDLRKELKEASDHFPVSVTISV